MSDQQFTIVKPNLAIDGIVTAKMRDGRHFTYRLESIEHGKLKGSRIVSLLTGSDNTSDYTGFAFINNNVSGDHWLNLWKRLDHLGYRGHVRVLTGQAPEVESFMQSGYCMKCGRLLTNPESLAIGLGPTCSGKT